jgi:hypothetical protein
MSRPVIAGGKRYVAPLKAEALPFAIPMLFKNSSNTVSE